MQTQETTSKISQQEAIQNWLINKLAEQLSLDTESINVSEPLTRYGLDSIDAVTMVGDLEDWLDLELPSTLFWDHPTIDKSAQYLQENYDLSAALAHGESASEAKPATQAEPVAAASKGWGGFFGKGK